MIELCASAVSQDDATCWGTGSFYFISAAVGIISGGDIKKPELGCDDTFNPVAIKESKLNVSH